MAFHAKSLCNFKESQLQKEELPEKSRNTWSSCSELNREPSAYKGKHVIPFSRDD